MPMPPFAIWQAHEMQCCYGLRPLHYGEMQIDHIIPEAAPNDPGELAKVSGSADQ